jgi:Fe-S-cluster-containing hydrogenase component 2/CRP-like cAMP-binding protein
MSVAAAELDALLASPLFADASADSLAAIRAESAIGSDGYEWPAGVAPRPGFVRIVTLRDEEEVIRQGEMCTHLAVVLAGQLEAVQSRAGSEPYRHRVHVRGSWFGEASAICHHAALATYRAIGDATVALLESRLLTRLYAEDETLRGRIDASYHDGLPLHLRASALCRDLDDAAIASLQRAAELRLFDEGDVVAAAGDEATSVWLVRAGAVACVATADGAERTLAFYKGNATFGEHAITAPGGAWSATYKALTRSALVSLPRGAFAGLADADRRTVARAANRLVGADDVAALAGDGPAAGISVLDELHVMVERESVKGGRALVIDRQKCVRCNMCVESCAATHDDGVPRLSKAGTPVATDETLITACYHCEVPQCMLSCEYAAIRRDAQGRIRFEYDSCVGCASCIDGCPYGVIRLVPPAPPAPPIESALASLPWIGRWFRREPAAAAPAVAAAPATPATGSCGVGGKVSQVTGKTVKCDLCAGMPFEACVYNCPTSAITRREPQSLFDRRIR